MPDISGVGVSFGADRIYDVMQELNLFPEAGESTSQVFFVNFGEEEEKYCLKLLTKIRKAGINAELFPEAAKMKKQMTYADKKNIPFVVMVGKNEMENNVLSVKNMKTGEQEEMGIDGLIERVGG
jgi:histidyl-tRNA synthetase